jgi:hypothetical protein
MHITVKQLQWDQAPLTQEGRAFSPINPKVSLYYYIISLPLSHNIIATARIAIFSGASGGSANTNASLYQVFQNGRIMIESVFFFMFVCYLLINQYL